MAASSQQADGRSGAARAAAGAAAQGTGWAATRARLLGTLHALTAVALLALLILGPARFVRATFSRDITAVPVVNVLAGAGRIALAEQPARQPGASGSGAPARDALRAESARPPARSTAPAVGGQGVAPVPVAAGTGARARGDAEPTLAPAPARAGGAPGRSPRPAARPGTGGWTDALAVVDRGRDG